jgi:glycine/D-amino acid oxidase-like deaminating enzyme
VFLSRVAINLAATTVLPGRQGAWDTRKVMVSYRLDQEGRFILGSIGRPAPAAGATRNWAAALTRRLFPELGDVAWEHQWSGRIAMTSDHMPRLHRLACGVITPIGYNGRGIGPGTVFGKAIAEHLAGAPEESLPLPITKPGSEPLRGARALAFEAAFQLGHLKQRFL